MKSITNFMEVGEELDSDGDMEYWVGGFPGWLSKEEATALANHLVATFKIRPIELLKGQALESWAD